MLTYDLSGTDKPLYEKLYNCIKQDILLGNLSKDEKLPSKRTLAKNLGISIITVENAYEQLIAEGYVYALPKKGYYVEKVYDLRLTQTAKKKEVDIHTPKKNEDYLFDFSSNKISADNFPFSTWAKLMRETISMRERELLDVSPCGGVYELRKAIADHLESFRAMPVHPDQIIVGAGTEYLYGLLIKLLGKDQVYCVENPGYKKISQVYNGNDAKCIPVPLDEQGMRPDALAKSGAQIAHISPTHHFPTGITMPISRRHEILSWAGEADDRYIIEDDYDSEFRLNGKPMPSLFSIDSCGKVIYINTFSKSLTSTIRIGYMVLPEKLANEFYEKLSFYSCTVSTFEQYTLSQFISRGYFEKHINRMRLHYGRKRARVLSIIRDNLSDDECRIIESDSGLHFLMQINTSLSDKQAKQLLASRGIKIRSMSDFYLDDTVEDSHSFVVNYSSIDEEKLPNAIEVLREILIP